jgi:hypothetical protein
VKLSNYPLDDDVILSDVQLDIEGVQVGEQFLLAEEAWGMFSDAAGKKALLMTIAQNEKGDQPIAHATVIPPNPYMEGKQKYEPPAPRGTYMSDWDHNIVVVSFPDGTTSRVDMAGGINKVRLPNGRYEVTSIDGEMETDEVEDWAEDDRSSIGAFGEQSVRARTDRTSLDWDDESGDFDDDEFVDSDVATVLATSEDGIYGWSEDDDPLAYMDGLDEEDWDARIAEDYLSDGGKKQSAAAEKPRAEYKETDSDVQEEPQLGEGRSARIIRITYVGPE